MKLLLDENTSDRRLASRLLAQGHDPILSTDIGLLSATTTLLLARRDVQRQSQRGHSFFVDGDNRLDRSHRDASGCKWGHS